MMRRLKQSWESVLTFLGLIFSWDLHTSRQHLWEKYQVSDGKTYAVFRETISDREYSREEATLIIGFRLSLIGSNRFFHWVFQRLCVLDTPIWVGFDGFKKKFWMVEPDTKDYLGIYRYQGRENAKKYAEYICAVLRTVSTKGSVWYKITEEDFHSFTTNHKK